MLVSEIPALRDYWYPVAYGHEVTGDPLRVVVFGEGYVLWRPRGGGGINGGGINGGGINGGGITAAVDKCPHRAARLSQGWIEGAELVCPYHGWRYDASGACTTIPALDPLVPVPRRACLATVMADERYGLVWICVGHPAAGIPTLGELDDPDYTLIHELKQTWAASAPRLIDNALDVSHVAFVHRGTVGDPDNARLSDFEVQRDGHRICFSVTYKSAIRGRQVGNVGLEGVVTRRTDAELVQPFIFRGALVYENGLRHVLFKTCTPVDDDSTLFFQFIGRNDAPEPDRWADITSVDVAVQAEDRALLEGIESDFPLALTAEVHTRADRMTIEYRRVLAELADL